MPHNQFSIEMSQQIDREWWNSLVQSVPEGTIFQTTYWADYLKEWANAEPIYFIVRNKENKVVGILLCFKEAHFSITTSLLKRFLPVFSWHQGPLILSKNSWKDILEVILKNIKNIAHNNTISGTSPFILNELPQQEVKKCFLRNGFESSSWATFLIDLTLGEDELWNNLNRAGRRMVKRCQQKEVKVERISTEDELEKYYKLLLETRQRLGFNLPPCFPNRIMWKYLKEKGILEVFVAKQNNKWLAALGVIGFNNVFNEIAVAQSNYSLENKIYANDFIKWEIIKWGHQQGYKIYDLAGVSPKPKTTKEKGIYGFKAKWGGKLVSYYTYNKPSTKVKRLFAFVISLSVSLLNRLKRGSFL